MNAPKSSCGALFCGLALLLSAGGAPGAPALTEDPPPASKPQNGDVTGTITPTENIKSLQAVSRVSGKSYACDSYDRTTGKFLFKALPGDARYDVCVALKDGREVQGIDLDFADRRLLALADLRRKELGLPVEPPHSFVQQDTKALLDYVTKLEDFMELRRPLYIQAHGGRATMLVELMRTREFYSSAGKIVWRIELWYFEYQHGGWERVPNQERVLHRERVDQALWKKIDFEFYPELSAFVTADGKSRPIDFKLPEKPDPSRGRTANTEPELKTQPHVLGLDEPATATAP